MAKYFRDLTDSDFDTFSGNLDSEVTLHGAAWNIPAPDIAAMAAARVTYAPLYNAIKIKNNRTTIQVNDHREGRTVFEDFIEGFANQFIIPNPLISNSIKENLGFTVKSDSKSPRPQIVADVFAKMEPLSDGRMQFICRLDTDGSRASIHEDADGVELRYAVTNTPPTTVAQMPLSTISRKAKFIIQTPDGSAGTKIFASLRWVNTSDTDKSGPWCQRLESIVIN